MGASYYETEAEKAANAKRETDIGIGRGTIIRKAIIDQNARIGGDAESALTIFRARRGFRNVLHP
jgi:ADP-glucose pyrophosphorylase